VSDGPINRHDGVGVMTHPDAPARIAAPTDFSDSPLSQALRQPMMLGLFLPIQAGGWARPGYRGLLTGVLTTTPPWSARQRI
jgi:hypothetical protein